MSDQRRIERLEYAVATMAAWLVEAQTGFGVQDMRGIDAILDGNRDHKVKEFARREVGGGGSNPK